jgi:sigma-B regulation protein RsbU (phosphoserine phosphatase)
LTHTTSVANRNSAERPIETIAKVVEDLATSSDGTELADRLTLALVEHFDASLAEIWLGDPAGEAGDPLERAAACSAAGSPAASPVLGARWGKITEPSIKIEGGESGGGVRLDGAGQHLLVYPIAGRDRPLGVLTVYREEAFPAASLEWARLYAGIAGATLDTARVLQESRKAVTQLQFIVEASQVLNSTLDLAELLDLILKLARREVGADRGTVYVVDQEHHQIWTILAQGLEQQEIRLNFGQGVAGYVAETGKTLIVDDAYTFDKFDRSFDDKTGYRTRSILCLPIRNRTGGIAGILQLFNKFSGVFTREDEEFLNTISLHMALALENARLHREMVEKKRLERELQLARGIQRNLLPEAPPVVAGFDIAVSNEPCFEVGGDYYDFLTMGPNTLLLVVADVEGKGVSSAMVMSNLQATLRALVMHLHSLEAIALSLNEMILADTRSGKFLSCFLGLVDTAHGGLHFINAGHVPPLVLRRTGETDSLEAGGMPIGLFPAVEYERGSVKLHPGDILLCCTDGIGEAANTDGDEFGAERLAATARLYQHLSASEMCQNVVRDVDEFSRGGPHIDDKVLMVVKVLDLVK